MKARIVGWLLTFAAMEAASPQEHIDKMRSGIGAIGHGSNWEAFAAWFDSKIVDQLSGSFMDSRFLASKSFALGDFNGTRGLKTHRSRIEPNQAVAVIPCLAAMTIESASRSTIGSLLEQLVSAVSKKHGASGPDISRNILTLHLAWEALHLEESPYKEYVLMLPPVGSGVNSFADVYRAKRAAGEAATASRRSALTHHIREAQWRHWVGGKDRWEAAAKVVQWIPPSR
eukprot:gnl/TRDRNA2_/TRDRNA2_133329_c1_seq1.p1 gnl/TRDRNA2_/TRDRNA2_133329_c1~~gnl/TRDRNA2_/TRDRNA2_133329_c1_seq1.p1  ORF type:complete len:229 (+),score=40.32 gnl/TRDRNA2_/TRDRNA2_133329_c1_seq1:152-838(+)